MDRTSENTEEESEVPKRPRDGRLICTDGDLGRTETDRTIAQTKVIFGGAKHGSWPYLTI